MKDIKNVSDLANKLNDLLLLRPIDTLHEDDGDVLLWRVPICDPPDVGSSLDDDFNEENYTHWSKIPDVEESPSVSIPVDDIDDDAREIKIIEKIDINTPIDWWNNNRKRINRVIDIFNSWQTDYKFSAHYREVVVANIKSCRKYGDENNFPDWQLEILDEMAEWTVKNKF